MNRKLHVKVAQCQSCSGSVTEARPKSEELERIRTARRNCPGVHMTEVKFKVEMMKVDLEKTGKIAGI